LERHAERPTEYLVAPDQVLTEHPLRVRKAAAAPCEPMPPWAAGRLTSSPRRGAGHACPALREHNRNLITHGAGVTPSYSGTMLGDRGANGLHIRAFTPTQGPASAGLSFFCSGCPVNIPMIVPGVFCDPPPLPGAPALSSLSAEQITRWHHTPCVIRRAVRLATTWRPSAAFQRSGPPRLFPTSP
jgi:hypothetical protein